MWTFSQILTWFDLCGPLAEFWLDLTYLDLSWSLLTYLPLSCTSLDLSWPILTYLDLSLPLLTYLDLSWPKLTYLDKFFCPSGKLRSLCRILLVRYHDALKRKTSYVSPECLSISLREYPWVLNGYFGHLILHSLTSEKLFAKFKVSVR